MCCRSVPHLLARAHPLFGGNGVWGLEVAGPDPSLACQNTSDLTEEAARQAVLHLEREGYLGVETEK